MFFRMLWNLLKNLKWVITIALILLIAYTGLTQYQAIKASPVGKLLPSTAADSFSLESIKNAIIKTDKPTSVPTVTPWPSATKIAIQTTKGTVLYSVEVATTPEARALGLMYRKSIPQYAGMLFVFEYDIQYGFWMKNCEFPQDMLFVDSSFKIVDIKENVPPCKKVDATQENCPMYTPKAQYRYVLELNAGSAKLNGVEKNQTLTFEK
jgi:uncharacterized membrane protein (UPF0127 family)